MRLYFRAAVIASAVGLGMSLVVPMAADAAEVTISVGPNFLHLPAPLSTSDCQTRFGVRCYSVAQLHTAYNLDPLYRRGVDGRGETIVIPVPFGSPTIRHDLSVFDRTFGLPDTDVRIMRFGNIPPYDPNSLTRVEWAAGTTFAVEYAHAIAPRANIVIAETPVSETVGTTGFPELMNAEESLIRAGIGDVIAQIESTAEGTFPDTASLLALRGAFRAAAAHGVTVLAAPGDFGVINRDGNGNPFPFPTVNWPSSDPLVTSVGGSQLYLDNAGHAIAPPSTWNDGLGGAGASGVSTVFGRPFYQSRVAQVVGAHRGTPDITMSGSVDGGVWVYTSFGGVSGVGWHIFDGTLESMSLFAGIVALADQMAGHRLGLINPALYALGARGDRSTGLVDITRGNNDLNGVTGFSAGPGYDLATGWGTIDAARFVPALANRR